MHTILRTNAQTYRRGWLDWALIRPNQELLNANNIPKGNRLLKIDTDGRYFPMVDDGNRNFMINDAQHMEDRKCDAEVCMFDGIRGPSAVPIRGYINGVRSHIMLSNGKGGRERSSEWTVISMGNERTFSRKGDSGNVVLNSKKRQAVALVMAGNETPWGCDFSYVTPLAHVFEDIKGRLGGAKVSIFSAGNG